MPTHRRWATCLAVLLLSYGSAIAQSTYGGLAGTARDQNGGVIAGAAILLVNEGTGKQEKTLSNGEGVFLIPQLPPGSYRIKITMNGFKETSYTGIQIYPGQEHSITAVMEIGSCQFHSVRRYLERHASFLSLRQVDPLIRQLTLYRDFIEKKTKENNT